MSQTPFKDLCKKLPDPVTEDRLLDLMQAFLLDESVDGEPPDIMLSLALMKLGYAAHNNSIIMDALKRLRADGGLYLRHAITHVAIGRRLKLDPLD